MPINSEKEGFSLLQRNDENAPKGLWYKRTAHGLGPKTSK